MAHPHIISARIVPYRRGNRCSATDDVEVALKFFDAARLTIAQIAKMPGMGSLYPVNNPRLQGLRKWAVKDFKTYLIFYFDHEDAIEIVRILYGTRDISSILDHE